jgi:hypothetical protein
MPSEHARAPWEAYRRRVYADLERAPEEELEPDLQNAQSLPTVATPDQDAEAADAPHAPLIALQRGAGNAATNRLLRMRAANVLAREADGAAPVPTDSDQPADPAATTQRPAEQVGRESEVLHGVIVPAILDRLVAPPHIGTSESLAEIALLARTELERRLHGGRSGESPGEVAGGTPPAGVASTVEQIQSAVLAVARERHVLVPGPRPAGDEQGLESEAGALAELARARLPGLAVEASAESLKFRFDGVLPESRIAGADIPVEDGPWRARASAGRDAAAVDLKLAAEPVELGGRIEAQAGRPTTWSAALEVRIAEGGPVPEPAALLRMIEAAGDNVVAVARYVGEAVARSEAIDRNAFEQQLKSAKESIEKVAGYIEKNDAQPASGPRAAVAAAAKGSEAQGVSATLTLTIAF